VLRAPNAAPEAPPATTACSCGAALAAGARFCAQCGQPQKPAGCPGCGAATAAGARFCAQCGHKFV
jgi:predicted amidophosphoribosyltransferase